MDTIRDHLDAILQIANGQAQAAELFPKFRTSLLLRAIDGDVVSKALRSLGYEPSVELDAAVYRIIEAAMAEVDRRFPVGKVEPK